MHLAKGETQRAIGLLETPIGGSSVRGNGNLTATEHADLRFRALEHAKLAARIAIAFATVP